MLQDKSRLLVWCDLEKKKNECKRDKYRKEGQMQNLYGWNLENGNYFLRGAASFI